MRRDANDPIDKAKARTARRVGEGFHRNIEPLHNGKVAPWHEIKSRRAQRNFFRNIELY